MNNEEQVIDLIRKAIADSDLTVRDSDGAIWHEQREEEIETIVHTIVSEVLDVYYLFLPGEDD